MRVGLRVMIGPRQKRNLPGLQRLAHHAHQVLAQPVRSSLLAQHGGDCDHGLYPVSTF